MRRFALLLAGVAMLGFAAGCSCLCPGYCGYGSGSGYGYGGGYGGGGACGPTGCPPATYGTPQTYPGVAPTSFQGAYQPSYDTMQAGIPGTLPMTASQPVAYTAGYPRTAMAPMNPLPTY